MARIATFTSGPPDGSGGTDRHLGLMTQVLQEDGHQLDHYHFAQLNPPRPWTLLDRLGFRHPGHGYHLYQRALAQPYTYDLFLVNSYLGAYIPSGQPVINIFHSCDAAYAEITKPALSLLEYLRQRWVWGYFERRSGRRHYPVAVSKSLERELWQYYRVKSRKVWSCCVDTEKFQPGPTAAARLQLDWHPDRPIVLFAGTWSYRKGADMFAQLSADLADKALFIAVSPPGGWDVPLSQTVQYVTNISSERMPLVFQSADLLVFPSRAESFGLVSTEALACSLATVTSQAGVGEEYRQDPTIRPYVLRDPIRYADLRSKVIELLEQPKLRQQLGQTGRDFVKQHYSFETFARELRHLIKDYLSSHPQSTTKYIL